jgi:AraC-like DNA-binding protein
MDGLVRNSPVPAEVCRVGRAHHHSRDVLDRHRHDTPFAAIILAGAYVEAGDTGRHHVVAGDVLVHGAFESHLDRFTRAAEVLVLPLPRDWQGPVHSRLTDPDRIARIAERDPEEARAVLAACLVPHARHVEDWPDMLAAALIAEPGLGIARWARRQGLHPGSIGRGFRQQFGLSPARFRATARAHRAVRAITATVRPLVEIAAQAGFADQAHMSHAVRCLTGQSPARLRTG